MFEQQISLHALIELTKNFYLMHMMYSVFIFMGEIDIILEISCHHSNCWGREKASICGNTIAVVKNQDALTLFLFTITFW